VEQSALGLTAKFQSFPLNTVLKYVRLYPQTFDLQEMFESKPYSRGLEAKVDLVKLLDEIQEEKYRYGRGIMPCLTISCSSKVLSECM
jgi:hypothetical protein